MHYPIYAPKKWPRFTWNATQSGREMGSRCGIVYYKRLQCLDANQTIVCMLASQKYRVEEFEERKRLWENKNVSSLNTKEAFPWDQGPSEHPPWEGSARSTAPRGPPPPPLAAPPRSACTPQIKAMRSNLHVTLMRFL